MWFLMFVMFFVMGSIGAASKGDYSGVAEIGKIIGFIAVLLLVCYSIMHPVMIFLIIGVLLLVAWAGSN